MERNELTTRDVVNQGLSVSLNEIGELDRFLSAVARDRIAAYEKGDKHAFRDVQGIHEAKLKAVASIAKLGLRTEHLIALREMIDFVQMFVENHFGTERRAIVDDETGFFGDRIDRDEREAFFAMLVEARLSSFESVYEIYLELVRENRRNGLNADDPTLRQPDNETNNKWQDLTPSLPRYNPTRNTFDDRNTS